MKRSNSAMKQASYLIDLLYIASEAKTLEEKARIAWRANDHMWRNWERWGIPLCREFNDLCQDQQFPWVEDLWSEEEMVRVRIEHGATEKGQ
jgi:hypothetical protein